MQSIVDIVFSSLMSRIPCKMVNMNAALGRFDECYNFPNGLFNEVSTVSSSSCMSSVRLDSTHFNILGDLVYLEAAKRAEGTCIISAALRRTLRLCTMTMKAIIIHELY